jgi:hypothetical protein
LAGTPVKTTPVKGLFTWPGASAGGKAISANGIWEPNYQAGGDYIFTTEFTVSAEGTLQFGGEGQPSGKCPVLFAKHNHTGDWVEACDPITRINFTVHSVWVPKPAAAAPKVFIEEESEEESTEVVEAEEETATVEAEEEPVVAEAETIEEIQDSLVEVAAEVESEDAAQPKKLRGNN